MVKPSGARSWVYRFMLRGKSRDIGLGPAAGTGAVSLAAARDAAAALRLQVRQGNDPLEERAREATEAQARDQAALRASVTFKAAAETYITANEDSWKNAKHRQQWRNTLASYVYPAIGELPVADITTRHVLEILEPIWREKPETASRVRGRIETVLDAAKARGYREGENPARWRGHIAQILPARRRLSRQHHKSMPYEAIPEFIEQLQARDAVSALALEFVILTAARTDEAIAATWQEVDLEKRIWTKPAARMKAGKEHRVPLSDRAIAILKEVQSFGGEYIFPSAKGGKLSAMAMLMLLRRMQQDCTVHGFRATFRGWAEERTSHTHEVCEMALAHTIANQAEAAYRRGDLFEKRRQLMDDWAAYCASRSGRSENVYPLRIRRDNGR